MSQASDLLNSLTDEQIAAYSAGSGDSEPHIVIGDDRYIKVPESLKKVAVQFDHDVETVIFDCPRYWDGLDMSEMAIYINYIRSDKYGDSYPAKNVTVEDDIMHFEWTISRNVTAVKGQLAFLVCIKKTDSEGNEVNHWNSEICTDMHISEGMETEEQALEIQPDLVTELLLRMASVEKINIQAEEMQALLNETKASEENASNAAAQASESEANVLEKEAYIRNSYANAIKGNVSGEIIRVDDVSPIEHDVSVRVQGKNLIPFPYDIDTISGNGITFTAQDDGGISASGTPTGQTNFTLYKGDILWSGNVTFSLSGEFENVLAVVLLRDDYDNLLLNKTIRDSYTFNFDDYSNAVYIELLIKRINNDVPISGIIYPMMEKGIVATEYTQFLDPTTVEVTRCGKTVFSKSEQVVSGVSKPWTSLLVAAVQVPPGTYTASCRFNQIGPDISRVSLSPRGYNDYTVAFGDAYSTDQSGYLEKTFTVTEGSGGFQLFLYSNTPNEALTTECLFKDICVEVGSVATGYSEYNGEVYTPNADGTVSGITSLSPTMTVYTKTDGVNVAVEYNRDTTKMFESYVLTDEAKSEIAGIVESDLEEVLVALDEYAQSLIGGDS